VSSHWRIVCGSDGRKGALCVSSTTTRMCEADCLPVMPRQAMHTCPPIPSSLILGGASSPFLDPYSSTPCLLTPGGNGCLVLSIGQPLHNPPPVIQVNRHVCRFERYKSPHRPHPPPRASRVSCHPPQVSDLTFAHPLLPNLARPRLPLSARPIESPYAGAF
jgi:hypothetical protein